MKVELNIEGSQLGETVVDLFKNLDADQRKEVAKSVLESWLRQPIDVERQVYETALIAEIRTDRNYANDTEASIRNNYRFTEKMKGFKSTREEMVKEVTTQAIAHFKEMITEKIKTDPQIQKLWEATSETLKADFPNIARDAMIAFFCTNMTQMAAGVQQALWSSQNSERLMGEVRQKLQHM